jgi:hypothetical protein
MVHADETTHILLVPYPAQGHLNPILQFGKRLAGHGGVRCTVAATRFVVGSTKPSPGSVHVAVFSDGCDAGGPAELGGHTGPYFEQLKAAGSEALDELLRSEAASGRPVRVVVYDTFMPWVAPLARRHGAACAAVLTQTCAVDIVYTHARAGRVPVPVREGGLPTRAPWTVVPARRRRRADVPDRQRRAPPVPPRHADEPVRRARRRGPRVRQLLLRPGASGERHTNPPLASYAACISSRAYVRSIFNARARVACSNAAYVQARRLQRAIN